MLALNLVSGTTKRILLVAGIFALLPIGCAEDDDNAAASTLAQRGESCQSRLDCAVGLSCLNKVCTVANFAVPKITKECVVIECREATDCCNPPVADCALYQQQCSLDPLSVYCTYYDTYCTCALDCIEDKCTTSCDTDADCAPGRCVAAKCVECAANGDCPNPDTQMCVEQECVEKCSEKIDCPYFHDCQDGACKEVGCANNRECIAATKNILATCVPANADHPVPECQIPCQTDAECQTGVAYSFMACINQVCVDVGCESDDECRLRYSSSGLDAACRDITNL